MQRSGKIWHNRIIDVKMKDIFSAVVYPNANIENRDIACDRQSPGGGVGESYRLVFIGFPIQ